MNFKEFEQKVLALGLKARDCGGGHWRIEGGKYEVNWWPNSRRQTIYVNGLARERTIRYGNFEEAIKLATLDPEPDHRRKARRKKSYSRVKRERLKRDPFCHWCRTGLTIKTVTIDHVVPLLRGGSNADDNLVISCEPCNKEKGHEIRSRNETRRDADGNDGKPQKSDRAEGQ